MAYPTNWDTYKSNASMFAGLYVTAPILGSSSLRMHRNAQASQYINAGRNATPRAFTSGIAMIAVTRLTNVTGDRFGYVFQQSQADLTGGAGSAYFVALEVTSSTQATLQLRKCNGGLATTALIATGATGLDISTTLTLRVRWILDIPSLGGLWVRVDYGTDTNYATASWTASINETITSSILTTSVNEGPALALTSAGSNGDYLWDHFDITPYVI